MHPSEGDEQHVDGEVSEESEQCENEICNGGGFGGSGAQIGESVKESVDQAMKLLNDQVS